MKNETRYTVDRRIVQESQNAYKESLSLIYNFFHKKAERIYEYRDVPALYGAVAYLCDSMKMPVIPLQILLTTSGEQFTIADIARLSQFPCRKVLLEDRWYRRDSGHLIAWMKTEDGEMIPVACFQDGLNGYSCFNPETGETKRLDYEMAKRIKPEANMLYRPFPNETITARKLLSFGFSQAGVTNWLAFGAMSALITVIGLLLPYLTQLIYDKYIGMADTDPLIQLCLVILVCNLASLCFGIVKNLAMFRGVSSMKYAVQSAMYDRLFNLPDSKLRGYESADIGTRTAGIGVMYDELLNVLIPAVFSALFSFAYLGVMLNYSKSLTMWGMGMVLAVVIVVGPFVYKQRKYSKKQIEMESKIASTAFQLIEGAAKIKVAGAENKAMLEYLKPYAISKQYFTKTQKMTQSVTLIRTFALTLFSAVFYFLVISRQMELTMGAFLGFISAFGVFSGAVFLLIDAAAQTSNILPLYDRAKPILEELPDYSEYGRILEELKGDIEVEHVNFSYSPEEPPVLEDLSLHIRPGEYVGIVGPSGCGKSTLLKLFLGFEEPTTGKIYYDSNDIEKLNRRELRKKMGVVLQNGKVFAGSIYENITLTSQGADLEIVQKVIEQVGLARDIACMPMGIHTYLAEGGGTISGGQQQRILIARAIISNPRILLFDEATSALDNVTQDMVCESLGRLQATRIVVAHRLSTIAKCDRILVMNKGKFVEEGNYQELMEKQGLFYRLATRQIS